MIGGSGLYDLADLHDVERVRLTTPFGDPSDEFVIGTLSGCRVAFLPRHGRGHRLLPTELNFRANIHGMKQLGVVQLLAVGAVGSLREEIVPGHVVVPDQFIDRTFSRNATFFGDGVVAHVQFGDPVCGRLAKSVAAAARSAGATVHEGGTYVCMEGPQFSTRAESESYRQLGFDIIGMTNLQEARLAREAEICYVSLSMVTDYDCWHESEEAVSGEAVMQVVMQNAKMSQEVVRHMLKGLPEGHGRGCLCESALAMSLITERSMVPAETVSNLRPIIGKYFGQA